MLRTVDFIPEYLPEAGRMALSIWEDETPDIPRVYRDVIYAYLPRYYYDQTSPYNLAVLENGHLQALLLASADPPEPVAAHAWLKENLPPGGWGYAQAYQKYLDGNRRLEDAYRSGDDVVLLFFASIRPGCGKLLMQEFCRRLLGDGKKSMLLWTDNTCDYQYYWDHDFTLLCRQCADPGLAGLSLETMIFRKEFAAEY